MGLTKAIIENRDKRGKRIECLFNPNEYTITKSNTWQQKTGTGNNTPKLDFSSGGARTLTMELMFDTFEQKTTDAKQKREREATNGDVRFYVNQLWDLTMIDESLQDPKTKKSRPPLVEFSWGASWTFTAVITNLSVRYVLFREDGTPVRAMANVTFQEAMDERYKPAQNPTSTAIPGYRRRVVQAGDALARIAFEEYGSATEWRRIADANELDDPLSLRAGNVLAIPPM